MCIVIYYVTKQLVGINDPCGEQGTLGNNGSNSYASSINSKSIWK